MSKQERLDLLKERHGKAVLGELPEETLLGILPVTPLDEREAISELDSYREYERDIISDREALTSDELA